MKAYTLAFLTLAAVAVVATANKNEPTMSKAEYLQLLENKFAELENRRRTTVDIDQCHIMSCGDKGDYCHENVTCRGFLGCINDTCAYQKAGDRCDVYYAYNSRYEKICFAPNLYCDENRCREYAKPGTICANQADCKSYDYDLYCNVLDSDTRPLGFCKLNEVVVKKIGEKCDYASQRLGKEHCEYGASYCTADKLNREGVCKALPKKLNEPCEVEHGCNVNKTLYCFAGNNTCQYLPKEGQLCANGMCFPGLYCAGTFCRQRKEINETCSSSAECVEDLDCLYSQVHEKYICTYKYLLEGEWCPDPDSRSHPVCIEDLECVNNTCIRKEYECYTSADCPDFNYFCDSEDHKCKGGMKIGEDEKCSYVSDSFNSEFGIYSTLQCKAGHVCIRNVSQGSDGYICKKAYSQKGHLNYCKYDSDCPYDSRCECDDNIGLSVCVPIPPSSKKLKEMYKNYLKEDSTIDDRIALYEHLIDKHFYYSSNYRCEKYYMRYNSASALKSSVVMTAIFALLAFLLF